MQGSVRDFFYRILILREKKCIHDNFVKIKKKFEFCEASVFDGSSFGKSLDRPLLSEAERTFIKKIFVIVYFKKFQKDYLLQTGLKLFFECNYFSCHESSINLNSKNLHNRNYKDNVGNKCSSMSESV